MQHAQDATTPVSQICCAAPQRIRPQELYAIANHLALKDFMQDLRMLSGFHSLEPD